MKRYLQILSCLVIVPTYLVSSTTTSTKPKVATIQAKVAQIKTTLNAHKATTPPPKPTQQTVYKSPDGSHVASLIDDLIEKVAKIKCSCGVLKKDKDNKKSSDLPMCKHDKDHANLVDKAFEAYKKLFDYLRPFQFELPRKDQERVNSSIHKLFECKNIQKMPWHPREPKVQPHKSAAAPIQAKQSEKQSGTPGTTTSQQ